MVSSRFGRIDQSLGTTGCHPSWEIIARGSWTLVIVIGRQWSGRYWSPTVIGHGSVDAGQWTPPSVAIDRRSPPPAIPALPSRAIASLNISSVVENHEILRLMSTGEAARPACSRPSTDNKQITASRLALNARHLIPHKLATLRPRSA